MKSSRICGLFHRIICFLKVKKKNETEFTHYEVFRSPCTKLSKNSV